MKTDDIRWKSFERSALPQALFGNSTGGVRGLSIKHALDAGSGIAFGYSAEHERPEYTPPALIVLADPGVAQTLSWLRTYAPETSPLSQFARVLSHSDWEQFGLNELYAANAVGREDRWACVVTGELLAQGESDFELSALPLSWGASCFSASIARTCIVYSSEEVRRTCIERLVFLEKDRKFARRPVSIAVLRPVWAIAASSREETLSVPEVVNLIFEAVGRLDGGQPVLQAREAIVLGLQTQFLSDSIESRVLAFHRLVSQITDDMPEASQTHLTNVIIAAGAFLVGRGTSHSFLLGRLAKRWSQTFLWFGLMAGLAGPSSWDSEWSRAAKGVERSLRGRFDLCDPLGADLCWTEYSWLTTTFTGNEVFSDLPKMLPKVLSVEIVPGATCQLRLVTERTALPQEPRNARADVERRDRELRNALEQLASLALRAQHLMGDPILQSLPGQGELRFDPAEEQESSTPRPRRNKRPQG